MRGFDQITLGQRMSDVPADTVCRGFYATTLFINASGA